MENTISFEEWLMQKWNMDSSNKAIHPLALQAFKNIYEQEKKAGKLPNSEKDNKLPQNDSEDKIYKDADKTRRKSEKDGKLDIDGFLKIAQRSAALYNKKGR